MGGLWQLQQARRVPIEAGLASDLARSTDGGLLVVGTIDDAVVGYGCAAVESLADGSLLSVISDLYVDPEACGVGVGEAMVGLLVDHARSVGAVGIDAGPAR